ncbi:MAG: formylglycine-generating enzyme family protein, partial [Kiritimatiellae bacterium]|nr:formylglycine-generating enzyme family protein [Kiritimatiellia bacterium]
MGIGIKEVPSLGRLGGAVALVAALAGCIRCGAAQEVPAGDSSGPRQGEERVLSLPGGAQMEMIYVAPGSFTMGSPTDEEGRCDNETPHRVTLTKGYWLGKYEVTQRQWRSVMGETPSYFKGDDRPVENVSWDDCQKFIGKVSAAARRQLGGEARLPTEAEWE